MCAVDILGGVFAVDWGAIGNGNGEMHHRPFDTMKWQACGFGHFDFPLWALVYPAKGDGFYRQWRWAG